jgi:hypothetical protein
MPITGFCQANASAFAMPAPTSSAPAQQRQHAADMVARCEFGHHAAVFAVHGDLRVQGVGKQAAPCVVERQAGFVAGTFNTENKHGG